MRSSAWKRSFRVLSPYYLLDYNLSDQEIWSIGRERDGNLKKNSLKF